MSWLNNFALLQKLSVVLLFALTACGFQPIYGEVDDKHIEAGTYMASTTVKAVGDGPLVQELKNTIEDRINPESETSLYGDAFLLQIRVDAPRTPLGIDRTGAISRYDITLTSQYVLYDAETHEMLDKGTLTRRASYFNADEKFAAYSAEQDAIGRGIKELAEDYKIRLASFFAEHYKLSTVAD